MITTLLVDKRNFAQVLPQLQTEIQSATFLGLDIETEDSKKHEGLVAYNKGRKGITFDQRRQVVCGISLYVDGSDTAFYINLNHVDIENRVPWEPVRDLIESRPTNCTILCHNAPFELTVLANVYDYHPTNVVCTLQMCVSAYSPDEYDVKEFIGVGLGPLIPILPALYAAGSTYAGDRNNMTPQQSEVFGQITGKESEASFSYNGFVNSVSYGYGLKKAIKSWFGHSMTTYKEVIGKRNHMGELTGEEVASYGAEDSYWCVRLFHRLVSFMMATNPQVLTTFLDQENPMIHVYSDLWRDGLKVNPEAIRRRRGEERAAFAAQLRKLRTAVRACLPFPLKKNAKLARRDKWYDKNPDGYRKKITDWALLPDLDDDLMEAMRVSGAISTGWASELGRNKPNGLNVTYYMAQRVLLYDLISAKIIVSDGKTSSDGEARGKVKESLTDPNHLAIIECLTEMAGIETRSKLFINPYMELMDPETGRLYPVLTSKLATRRMATSSPNSMQLTKRGEGTWIRGFFGADYDDHLLVSLDWSGIELVEIGEFSQDPSFIAAYGQLPHKDLHSQAAASILSSELKRTVSVDEFKRLPTMTVEEATDLFTNRVLLNSKGVLMSPSDAYKFHRGNDGGKGANFNFWYSGALSTIGEKRGWTSSDMWAATDAYKAEFPVAEQWRLDTIAKCQTNGYVELLDGHRRTRFEATTQWREVWMSKFAHIDNRALQSFVGEIARAIQSRAKNQAVNAVIQGACAFLAKRSIIRLRRRFEELGWTKRECRFQSPIHDELVFSIHKDFVVPAIHEIHQIMCSHPDIFKVMKLDASPSIGLSFEPWHPTKAPFGQIELYECPELPGVRETGRLTDAGIQDVVDYLMQGREEWKRAA